MCTGWFDKDNILSTFSSINKKDISDWRFISRDILKYDTIYKFHQSNLQGHWYLSCSRSENLVNRLLK